MDWRITDFHTTNDEIASFNLITMKSYCASRHMSRRTRNRLSNLRPAPRQTCVRIKSTSEGQYTQRCEPSARSTLLHACLQENGFKEQLRVGLTPQGSINLKDSWMGVSTTQATLRGESMEHTADPRTKE